MNLTSIIKQCLHNDRSAQRMLYDRYKDSLYTIAIRLTNDTDEASDLLQEAFIDAFKNLSNLKEPTKFHSWIKQILVRKAYYQMKHKRHQVDIDSVVLHQTDHVDIDYIERAIQTLPLKSRTVFIMYEIEGFSHAEISDTMQISIGTSKSQLNFAKTKLKEQLQPYLQE